MQIDHSSRFYFFFFGARFNPLNIFHNPVMGQNLHHVHELFQQLYFLKLVWFFKIFMHLFLDRGEGREKEGERNIDVCLPLVHPLLGPWPTTQACALTGSPLVYRTALNPLSHTSWAKTCNCYIILLPPCSTATYKQLNYTSFQVGDLTELSPPTK